MGCIIVELYTGEPLFPGETEHEQLLLIMEILGAPESSLLEQASKCNLFFYDSLAKPTKNGFYKEPQTRFLPEVLTNNSDPDFLDFIEKCLIIDPQKRMTPSLALEHQFISNNNGILKTKNIVRRKII